MSVLPKPLASEPWHFRIFPYVACLLLSLFSVIVTPVLSKADHGSVTSQEISEPGSPILTTFREPYSELESLDKRIRRIFLQLFPKFRPAIDDSCPIKAITPAGLARHLQYYELSTKQPLFIRLEIFESAEANAYSLPAQDSALGITPAVIILTRGLFSDISEDNELGFVLAHEMGHLVADSFPTVLPTAIFTLEQQEAIQNVHRNWELQADQYAVQTLREAGLELPPLNHLFQKLAARHEREYSRYSNHPSHSERVEAIQANLKIS